MRTSLTLICGLPLLAVLAACGSSSTSAGANVASLATSPAAAGPDSAAPAASDEDAALAYVECMRDEGIDLPDPVVADDGTIGFDTTEISVDPTSAAFAAANDACEQHLEGADFALSDDDVTAVRDAFQRFTDCLRGEGLDVGDFAFGDGNARRVVQGGDDLIDLVAPAIDGLNPSDPAHQAAVDACEPTLSEAFLDITGGGS
jgi:hypothetical protein